MSERRRLPLRLTLDDLSSGSNKGQENAVPRIRRAIFVELSYCQEIKG